MRILLALLILIIMPPMAFAQEPQFILPIQCKLDKDCWFVNYVDVNPKDNEVHDFRCGSQSYDGHKGTDIALRSRAEMRHGVKVIAAKAGTVSRLRDGESNTIKSQSEFDQLRKEQKECGNGIFIDHGSAVQTIYCHMKQGSITVKPGDKVEAGDILGEVGQSGIAEFPHLHFGIIWEAGIVDPFTGNLNTEGCGLNKGTLWADKNLKYDPISIYDGGFRGGAPDFKKIEEGEQNPDILRKDGDALVFWAAFYGVRADDLVTITIKDPQGNIFKEQQITQDKRRARQYYYTGRKLLGRTLPEGTYTGVVTLERDGLEKQQRVFKTELR